MWAISFQNNHPFISAQSSAPVEQQQQQQQEHCSVDGSCYFDILNEDSSDDADEDSSDNEDYDEEYFSDEHLLTNLYSFLRSQRYSIPLKTLERSYIHTIHPTALNYTLSHSGNYTDSTKAGSSQWVGRTLNAQIATNPTYTSFGSILDIVTSGTYGGRQSTMHWIATLFHRNQLVQYHGDVNGEEEEYTKPCRIDLLDDNDERAFKKQCILGVSVEEVVCVVSNENESVEEAERKRIWTEEQMIGKLGMHEEEVEVVSSLNDVAKGKLFDTIIVNGLPTSTQDEVDLKLEHVIQTYLKPGGIMYVFGEGPLVNEEENENGPGEQVLEDVLALLDSVKSVR